MRLKMEGVWLIARAHSPNSCFVLAVSGLVTNRIVADVQSWRQGCSKGGGRRSAHQVAAAVAAAPPMAAVGGRSKAPHAHSPTMRVPRVYRGFCANSSTRRTTPSSSLSSFWL